MVAGACCVVKYSYTCESNSYGYVGKWTLNINSTGAKNVVYYYVYATTHGDKNEIKSYNSADAFIGFEDGCDFLIYNGSAYISTGGLTRFYSDYTD